MTAKSLYSSGTGPETAQPEVLHGDGGSQPPGAQAIDWRNARLAGRACCCSAKPAVIAVMPATASRPHPTDLLLCGHHYRASGTHLISPAPGSLTLSAGRSPATCGWLALARDRRRDD